MEQESTTPLINPIDPHNHQSTNTPVKDRETVKGQEAQTNIPWEAQEGWMYIGHGEWAPKEQETDMGQNGGTVEHEPQWLKQWLLKHDEDVQFNKLVRDQGYPNRWGGTDRS